MKVCFDPAAWADYLFWAAESDLRVLRRINALIEDARRHAFTGLGKPEPLRNELRGFWSRRITAEHRLVYAVNGTAPEQTIMLAQCRYHYER